jgi:methylase of polypeptide subunit release factors
MDARDQALVALGRELKASNYRFTTITPASHDRVNRRPPNPVSPLEAVFGWSRAFDRIELPEKILALLERAEELGAGDGRLRSKVRFSTLGEQLFAHSAFPTDAPDTVFFGPDTYRFARALRPQLADIGLGSSCTIIDIGCGSGAGGLHTAALMTQMQATQTHTEVILADINPRALRYSQVNASLNGVSNVRTVLSDVFDQINEGGDLIIANPPYLVDRSERLYRHGGGPLGFDLSLRIVEESIDRLYPGGRLFLYTGTPVVDGIDTFFEAVRPRLEARNCNYGYEEVDPDVFGEELENAPYDRVDRIAAVALTVHAQKGVAS